MAGPQERHLEGDLVSLAGPQLMIDWQQDEPQAAAASGCVIQNTFGSGKSFCHTHTRKIIILIKFSHSVENGKFADESQRPAQLKAGV